MVPRSLVVSDLAEHADVGNWGQDFREVRTIPTDKQHAPLDRWHPEVIQYDMGAGLTDRRREREIDERIIEPMTAVDENHTETALLPG